VGDTADEVEALGRRSWAVGADLADLDATTAEIGRVLEAHRVDVLVNNAGIIRRAPAAETSLEDWRAVLTVKLDSPFVLASLVGRQMLDDHWGRIVNMASLLSFQGGILVPAYTASKHALAGLTRALANEWVAQGVTVNAVAPG
jgi:2-deoxy-D-gluconate 3-dehydrogenase